MAVTEFDKGRFEAFERITTAYHGKQMYFLEDTTMVYSRWSHSYMPIHYAIAEFCQMIEEVGKNESKSS